MTPVRLEPTAPLSPVKHSNAEPLHSRCLLTPLKYYVFENIMENGAFAGANAPFSIVILKYSKLYLNFS